MVVEFHAGKIQIFQLLQRRYYIRCHDDYIQTYAEQEDARKGKTFCS